MFLRKLTDKEIEQIKKSKEMIRTRLQELLKEIREVKKLRRIYKDPTLQQLERQLDENNNILTGLPRLPVILKSRDESMYMDYAWLKKIGNSLDRSGFWSIRLRINDRTLIIDYRKTGHSGAMKILELPLPPVEILTGLPVIDLEE